MNATRTPLKAISSRPKKCAVRSCRAPFIPKQSFQTWCSPECGLVIAKAKQEKQRIAIEQRDRREIRARKQQLKSRSQHLKEAQAAFNAYIRERDRLQPCISCNSMPDDAGLLTGSRWDAGHYRSTGACPELRFEPLNVHKQCVRCNRDLSGNAVEYRIRLVARIGATAVEWLEGQHEPKKYAISDLELIKAAYRKKLRDLKKNEAAHG
ncbi:MULTISPECIES: recombination protein NinG [unclassified Pseudomonas]|uniref:recombination protein NinG n=1 Tax=unclassified Pseudomonas TaxID=196821 RepID=UPI002447D92F|nr:MULTISPECIES: recombination protein NinG [unclassified Pseudomonas]MDG9927431.1 recombination protein NinG [Pseudomonas sp. GD04042]MDH0482500.1 recombination protein NinG [Pseudomonas sp. GD04015]MDH0602852.1 recombination protein NinG [Pseudomonas sp. GD03869]